jgi:hypothetical protein
MIDGLHECGGAAGRRVLDIGPAPLASGPSVPCTDPALARPQSPPMVPACFRSTSRCPERIHATESGNSVVRGNGGLRAKVYVWFEH